MVQNSLTLFASRYGSGGAEVKAPACNAGDLGSIPGLGRSPDEGNGNVVVFLRVFDYLLQTQESTHAFLLLFTSSPINLLLETLLSKSLPDGIPSQ